MSGINNNSEREPYNRGLARVCTLMIYMFEDKMTCGDKPLMLKRTLTEVRRSQCKVLCAGCALQNSKHLGVPSDLSI